MANDASPSFEIHTSVLHGVFVSHKSFAIGLRNLVEDQYAYMLALKFTGHWLPQELVDMVADELSLLKKRSVNALWRSGESFQENLKRIEDMSGLPDSAQEFVFDELVSSYPFCFRVRDRRFDRDPGQDRHLLHSAHHPQSSCAL